MAASSHILLLLGAEPNRGQAIAAKFASVGYKVALAARSLNDETTNADGHLQIKADFSNPNDVPRVFQTTQAKAGTPNIVTYNAANRITSPPEDPMSAPLADFAATRVVGFDSALVAAQEALKGFRQLPRSEPTAFIYTGNALNRVAFPRASPFAASKILGATLVEYAAFVYGKEGDRFYYADERTIERKSAMMGVDGPGHAEMYLELAHEATQSPWEVTFVKELGRKRSEETERFAIRHRKDRYL